MAIKILLADDEEDLEDLFRQQFRRQIQDNTYEFIFVRDGKEALSVVEQQPDIDVLVSDINMPGIDGLTLLTRLADINPIIRTVIITAYGDMSNIRTAMNQGAFDFLTKPINFRDLEVTLQKTIRSVSQHRENQTLKAMDEMKARFFANITHEFRTPLSLIVSPVEKLLETGDLPPTHQQALSTVQRNARQLLRLINQLLDISKLEAGQMDLANEVGDLPGFVGQIVDLFRPSATIKQLTLLYHTTHPSAYFLFDIRKWETILYNLLSNGIKFTETGGITVALSCTPSSVRLTVRDTGIGIATDKLPYIFNRFYQADSSRIRAYEGTGIGLALVHELTQRMSGTIRVQSQESHQSEPGGTWFEVDIPVQKVQNPPAAVAIEPRLPVGTLPPQSAVVSSTDAGAATYSPLVLVVEDNAELREFLVAELATTYRIRSAANGYEGWLVAREELPDVIVSDVMMPRMDGYELLRHIRHDPTTDHIAVILLTASMEPDNRRRGLTFGADEYLVKPFSVDELRLRLRNLFQRQAKLREAYRQQLSQPDSTHRLERVEHQFLRRLYGVLDERMADSTLSVEGLADELAMSRKKFYIKLRNLLQLSPVEVIRQYRLRRALDLLRAGHPASDVAYRVGFESPSYFTKVFREFYGQTPSELMRS